MDLGQFYGERIIWYQRQGILPYLPGELFKVSRRRELDLNSIECVYARVLQDVELFVFTDNLVC